MWEGVDHIDANDKKHGGPAAVLPQQVVQFGAPRTATTLQFQMLCVVAFLLHHDSRTKVVCEYLSQNHALVPPPIANQYSVFKTHHPLRVPINTSKQSLWIFATGMDSNWNHIQDRIFTEHQDDILKRYHTDIEKRFNWSVQATQPPTELSHYGWHHFAAVYAHAFRLKTLQLYALVDYIRYWDVLRQCCGAQMSDDWRKTLQGKHVKTPNPAVHSPGYPACETHNLDVVEKLLVNTEVFRRFGTYGETIQKNLNGTYCSWANNKIARLNLSFNGRPRK
jgi:hypothetical protein